MLSCLCGHKKHLQDVQNNNHHHLLWTYLNIEDRKNANLVTQHSFCPVVIYPPDDRQNFILKPEIHKMQNQIFVSRTMTVFSYPHDSSGRVHRGGHKPGKNVPWVLVQQNPWPSSPSQASHPECTEELCRPMQLMLAASSSKGLVTAGENK